MIAEEAILDRLQKLEEESLKRSQDLDKFEQNVMKLAEFVKNVAAGPFKDETHDSFALRVQEEALDVLRGRGNELGGL